MARRASPTLRPRPRPIAGHSRNFSEGVRQATDMLDEVGRYLPGAVAAQREGIHQPAEAPVDRRDDLVVPSDRGEEMDDVVGHLPRHLAPPPLPGQAVELMAEVFETMHREHRIIGLGRSVKRDALAHPFEALRDRLVVRAGGEKPTAGNLVLRSLAAGFGETGLDAR